METKANTTMIGLFTLGVIGLFAVFVWWFLRAGEGRDRTEYRIVFSGPVAGLRTGSSVLFNGLRVGEVRRISVDPNDPRQVIAMIAVDPTAPVRRNTRVSLDVQLLSGIAAVSLTGGAAGAEVIEPARPGEPPELRAEASAIQDLLQGARQIMSNVDNLVRRLDDTVAAGQGTIDRSLRNVEIFTKALGDNADGVGSFLRETGEAAKQIAALTQRLDRVTTQVETMLSGVEPGRVQSILRNVDDLTKGLADQNSSLADLLRDARTAANTLDRTLSSVNDVTRAFDVQALNRTLQGADRFIAAFDTARVDRAMANVERFTDALGRNSGSVDSLLKDAAEVAGKLNGMADRLDGLIRGFSGEGGSGMFAEFTNTARSVRVLAERLDQRTATLTTSISGFTDRTIRDIQSLATDGRRTLSELERTLRSLERNPQRFIFGGSGVPEYNRR